PIHKVHTVHFIVQAAITPQLKNNTIYITDYNGTWHTKKAPLQSKKSRYYIVTKKIRPGVTRLQLGIRFKPKTKKDQLTIDDIKIFITPAVSTQHAAGANFN
ncbi:MAG: hypothetical protein GY757_32535, partial [bacterium]|nr:hypothetical protein [bacterium]